MKHPIPGLALNPPEAPILDAAVTARLEDFLALLLRWNARINLVADATPDTLRQRHIADCLQLLPLLPPNDGPLGDLGSGAGLPGLVLAMATPRPVHLVESDRRKAAFLTEAAARLDLPHVAIHACRIEDARLPPLAILTARALAPLTVLLPHARRLLDQGGIAIFPKGRNAEAEWAATQSDWSFQTERFASRTDPTATIFRLTDIRHVRPEA